MELNNGELESIYNLITTTKPETEEEKQKRKLHEEIKTMKWYQLVKQPKENMK